MKKKVQKALGILTAFSMVLSMAGCGGNTSGETAQTGTDAAVESAAKCRGRKGYGSGCD